MQKNQKKFEKIYDQYNARIFRFIYLKVSSQEIAEDLASEVFMKAWSSFAKATEDEKVENIQAYIYQIARNVIADHYRAKNVQAVPLGETAEMIESEDSPEKKAIVSLEMERIKEALKGIHDDYQDLIIFRYVDELSYAEIAGITGKTEDSIRVGVHRALQALKQRLEGEMEV